MATPSAEQLRFPLYGDFGVFFPPRLLTLISHSGTHLRPQPEEEGGEAFPALCSNSISTCNKRAFHKKRVLQSIPWH